MKKDEPIVTLKRVNAYTYRRTRDPFQGESWSGVGGPIVASIIVVAFLMMHLFLGTCVW